MSDARRLPAAIDWHEGLLLAPQHFQQLDLRHEELLHYRLGGAAAFPWGVVSLEIDEAALTQGVLRFTALEAVLPDGLAVAVEPGAAKGLETDLNLHVRELEAGPCTVHVIVPARRPGLSPQRGDTPRYRSVEGETVVDESSGEGDVTIPRLLPVATLLVSESPPLRYTALPIARVRLSDGKFRLDEEFEPPWLRVTGGSQLGSIAAGISVVLRRKAELLSTRAQLSTVVGSSQVLETRLLIHSLAAGLPALEAVLGSGRAHPYDLYLALCEVAGHVAVVGHTLVPPLFPPYTPCDPMASFAPVRDFILRAVDEGISESHAAFRFQWFNGVYNLQFDEHWRDLPLVLGVRGRTGMSEAEVEAWVGQSLIGAKDRMREMRDQRILGAHRERIEREGDLVPASGVLLFSLRLDAGLIQPDEILQVWNVADRIDVPRVVEVVLYVKARR
jgi:type VI secretion system protein ImpJ